MKTYLLWTFQMYESRDDRNNLRDVVTVSVRAENEKEATKKAKKIIERNGCRVFSVSEYPEGK